MKSIKKLKSTGKAVAGSALLVGATLTGAAGLASAQDSGSMDLGDYPTPFINEDGEVDSTIVVGEQAQTADVVGAINVAGSLGNAAFMEEEVSVDVSGAVASWSADNGVTLDRRNSPIFFPQDTDSQKNRLDEDDVSALAETTFRSEDGTEVDVDHRVLVGNQAQRFSTDNGDLDDPALYVEVPSRSDVQTGDDAQAGDFLMQAEASFSETLDFTTTTHDERNDNADEVLEDGDEIELFGNEYIFSDESGEEELVLYGSSERFEVNTGESNTVTVDGEEATFEAQYVSDTDTRTATITVDGSTESVEEGDTVTVSGQDVRVSDIYRTGPDGEGRVAFSIGSEELIITDSEVEIDGDRLRGVDVNIDSNPADDGNSNNNGGTFEAVDGIEIAFGAAETDEDLVLAEEFYEDPLFGLEFHYGGLSGDVVNDPADVFEVDAQEDGDTSFTFTAGEETTIQLGSGDGSDFAFGPDDGDATIAQYEGQALGEDDYTVLNSNQDADMYEITNIDSADLENAGSGTDDETVSVTLENVVTGDSMEVEEDGLDFDTDNPGTNDLNDNGNYVLEAEGIEGKDYDITWHSNGDVSFERTTGDNVQLWPHMYSDSDAAFAIDSPDDDSVIDVTEAFDVQIGDFARELDNPVNSNSGAGTDGDVKVEVQDSDGNALSSSEGDAVLYDENGEELASTTMDSAQKTVSVGADEDVTYAGFTGYEGEVEIFVAEDNEADGDVSTNGESTGLEDAHETRTADIPSGVASNDATATVTFTDTDTASDISPDQEFVQYDLFTDNSGAELDLRDSEANSGNGGSAAVLVLQPEDDNDEENAYTIEASSTDDSQSVSEDYTGSNREGGTLDDEDVDVDYDFYGAYSMRDYDSSDQETFTLHLPEAQSTAGMAVTGADGSLSAEGGGSASATTQTATGWPGATALDSEVSGSDRDQNMILVGGPAVNTLTEELAQDNKTWTGDDYEEDTWVLDLVEGFSEDTHALVVAGYSAEDTRAASSYISNYADNEDELAGETTVSMTTSASQ